MIRSARRGVKVRVIVPGRYSDQGLVRLASRRMYRDLLEGGVRIFEYRPAMTHVKALMVDEAWAIVGTTNVDNRSFEHNDEINVAFRETLRDRLDCGAISSQTWRRATKSRSNNGANGPRSKNSSNRCAGFRASTISWYNGRSRQRLIASGSKHHPLDRTHHHRRTGVAGAAKTTSKSGFRALFRRTGDRALVVAMEPDAENHTLRVEADGDTMFSATEIRLAGEGAAPSPSSSEPLHGHRRAQVLLGGVVAGDPEIR